jgi:lysophospholipase L1-like esterase
MYAETIRPSPLTLRRAAVVAAIMMAVFARADDAMIRLPAKGERIVFLGDSITQAGAGPGGYVTLVGEGIAAALPEAGVEVIGAGISGNKVPDRDAYLPHPAHEEFVSLVKPHVEKVCVVDYWSAP